MQFPYGESVYRECTWRATLIYSSIICILLNLFEWIEVKSTAATLCWALLLRAVLHSWPSHKQRWNHAGWITLNCLLAYTAALFKPILVGPLTLICLWHEREEYHWRVDRLRRQLQKAVEWKCPYSEWHLRWNAFKYAGLILIMLDGTPLQHLPGGIVKVVAIVCILLTLFGWMWKGSKSAVVQGLMASGAVIAAWETMFGPATLSPLIPWAGFYVCWDMQREERYYQNFLKAFVADPEETARQLSTDPLLLEEYHTTTAIIYQYGIKESEL